MSSQIQMRFTELKAAIIYKYLSCSILWDRFASLENLRILQGIRFTQYLGWRQVT